MTKAHARARGTQASDRWLLKTMLNGSVGISTPTAVMKSPANGTLSSDFVFFQLNQLIKLAYED